jgi:hypothetical protein
MATRHEPFKRTLDRVEYAKRAGYEPRPNDGARGLTVLDPPHRGRIGVARSPGPWIDASVTDSAPRAPGEPAEPVPSRLRPCIDRATGKGSIVDFVQQRDGTARRGEVPLDPARERLREFLAAGRPLDFEGTLQSPPDGAAYERSSVRSCGASQPDGPALASEGDRGR